MEAELSRLNGKLQEAVQVKITKDEFSALKTEEERFSYTLKLLEKYDMTPKIEVEEKSSTISASLRKAGNALFVSAKTKGRRDEIIGLYTKAIAFAEPDSLELALAYANRSALLYEARLYDHCINDIKRALVLDYPQPLGPKLLSRQTHCLKALGKNPEEIKLGIQKIKLNIEAMTLDDGTKKKYFNAAEMLNEKTAYPAQRELFDEEKHKPATPNDNPELPGVSSALGVVYNEEFGRHVRARRNIKPGELLSVQQGYATILAPENFYTHCSNCLRQTWSSVPCKKCPNVVYCDEKCRDQAWQHHHAFECFVIGVMLKLEFNLLGLMSLRLAIQARKEAGSFEALKQKIEALELEKDPRTKGFTGTPAALDEKDYSSVYTLTTNTEQRSGPDLFGRCFNAVYVVYWLGKLTDFFGQRFTGDIKSVRENPWSIFIGSLIARHQQIIPSNVHTVQETKGLFDTERGASMQPFLSLLNHSCDCMVMRVHYGTSVALYALHPIQAGEQVFDNYGQHYAIQNLYTRKQKLRQQFFFECECRPCREDWPVYTRIPTLQESNLSRQQLTKVKKALKNFDEYIGFATEGNVQDKPYIIRDLSQMIETLFDNVHLPCREINDVTETLKRVHDLLGIRFQSLED